jgi:acyl transferase domain-containing protein
LLASWNIKPSSVVGHSSGEIAAAFSIGAISQEYAWKLAYYRGLLSSVLAKMTSQNPVGMMAVALSPSDVRVHISKLGPNDGSDVSIACFNSPRNLTLSGPVKALGALKDSLDSIGVFSRQLQVENAYHSKYMLPIADTYHQLIGTVEPGNHTKAGPKLFSSLTGKEEDFQKLQTPQYWIDNLIAPVKFSEAVTRMLTSSTAKVRRLGSRQTADPITELVEIGPHAALRGAIREILDTLPKMAGLAYASTLKRGMPATETVLDLVGWLYCRGHALDIFSIGETGTRSRSPQLLVDLPSYPFNHTKRYWSESRLSKSYRLRKFPRHELLGAPVPDWDEKNAVWRNFVRVSENPWIQDHKVTGSVLYPAAGMLVMGIEASRQVAAPGKIVKAFKFKEVSFHRALQVPLTAEGVETHFHLKSPSDSPNTTSSVWKEFEVRSRIEDSWIEHCRGFVATEYETPYTLVDGGLEEREFNTSCVDAIESAERSCQLDVSSKHLYKLLEEMGFQFGETFRTLSDIKVDQDRKCIATVSASDVRSKMAHGYIQPHLIHPSTLDGVLHSVVAAMTRGGRDIRDAMVPTSIKKLWVAAGPNINHDLHKVQAHAKSSGPREEHASIISIDPKSREPLVVVQEFVMTAISQREEAETEEATPHLCFNIDWKPDPHFITSRNAESAFKLPQDIQMGDLVELCTDLQTLCVLYLKRYMATNPEPDLASMKPHHQKFVAWMHHELERYDKGELPLCRLDCDMLAQNDEYFQALEARCESASPEGTLTVAFGQSMEKVLRGEADPLQIIFKDGKADNVYQNATGAKGIYGQMCGYLGALAHKNHDLKILEVGAGTGGATQCKIFLSKLTKVSAKHTTRGCKLSHAPWGRGGGSTTLRELHLHRHLAIIFRKGQREVQSCP